MSEEKAAPGCTTVPVANPIYEKGKPEKQPDFDKSSVEKTQPKKYVTYTGTSTDQENPRPGLTRKVLIRKEEETGPSTDKSIKDCNSPDAH